MNSSNCPAFRVIIVGGGVAGLALAHAFHQAKIDYRILEKRQEIDKCSGAGLGMWPQGARILDQIGVLDALKTISTPMKMSYDLNPDGSENFSGPIFDAIESRHGHPYIVCERWRFLETLYDHLPDNKAKVRYGQGVVSIDQDDTGVQVTLEDGSIETGDIVVGADGVHSVVRSIMWDHANAKSPNTISDVEKKSLTVRFKCIYGFSSLVPGLTPGNMISTHGNLVSFQLFTGPDYVFWFANFKLEEALSWPFRTRYGEEDMEDIAMKYAAHAVSQTVTFGDLWETKIRAKLANLEEGVFQHWHSGRIVLVGDSVHKMTPTLAFGANTALESVAALANNLNQIVSHASEKPSTETLEDIFTAYKTQRYSRAKRMSDITGRYTRLGAWDGMGAKFSTQYMVKILGRNLVLYMMGLLIKGAVKLDYIPTKERKAGTVQWDDEKTPRGWLSMAALYDPFVILATALTICRPYYTSLIPKARSTSGSTESLC